MLKRMSFRERFALIQQQPSTECWVWPGLPTKPGYSRVCMMVDKRPRSFFAHRLAYEAVKGPIPAGLFLDHLCRNKRCINPDHLEAVTARVNVLRNGGPIARNAAKTHCSRGHALTEDNVYITPSRGAHRTCRTCRAMWARKVNERDKAARHARGFLKSGPKGPRERIHS